MKLSRAVFSEPKATDVEMVGLVPSGDDKGGASVPGPKDGTVWNTIAMVRVPSTRTGIPGYVHQHASNSNPVAKDDVEALVRSVVLPRAEAEEPYKSNTDLFEKPTSLHIQSMEVHGPTTDKPRLFVCGVFKSTAGGVPDTGFQFSVDPPKPALMALLGIVDAFVLPAVIAEVLEP